MTGKLAYAFSKPCETNIRYIIATTAYQAHVQSQSLQGRTNPLGRGALQSSGPTRDRQIQAHMGYSQTQTQRHIGPGTFL